MNHNNDKKYSPEFAIHLKFRTNNQTPQSIFSKLSSNVCGAEQNEYANDVDFEIC